MKARAALLALLLGSALAAVSAPKATLKRLTTGACCTGVSWSPDSRALLYIDRPPGANNTAIYSVPANGGASPSVRFNRIAFYSPDLKYAAVPQGASTTVERLSDGQRWTLNTQGADLLWGPQGQVAYTVSAQTGNYDRRTGRVYVAAFGQPPKRVATLFGGALGWLNAQTLLVSGKAVATGRDRQLFTLNLRTGARTVLATALNLRGVQASPDGQWVAYYIAFDRPERNGMFVQKSSGGPARKLDWFGSYQWRDKTSLVYIPLTPGAKTHVLTVYDLESGSSKALLDLGAKVQADQWLVSPDGRQVAFRNANDGNLYTARLP